MLVDKSKWEKSLCKDCVKNINTQEAIQKKDYSSSGLYPIISQEKEYISGFTNTSSSLNIGLGDVVIFGDHTRTLKYVDFDFCVGADGVKVLKPIQSIRPKFLYYYLKWSDIPSNGYSRHYKFLKEVEIKIPSFYEQDIIVKELDSLQTIIDEYEAQIMDFDELIESVFNQTFGDIAINEMNWEIIPMGKLGNFKNGLNYEKGEKGKVLKFIGVGDFQNNKYLSSSDILSTIEVESISEEYLLKDEDIVFVRSNGNKNLVGRCLEVFPNGTEITYSGFCIRFRKTTNIINKYLLGVLTNTTFKKTHVLKSNGIGIQNINQKLLSNLPIPIPPIELQKKFENLVDSIYAQKKLLREQLQDAEQLMAERMQYYFS